MSVESEFDLGPLTWIKGELDHALDDASAALAGWNGADQTPLKAAAAHLHQVYGALQIVDLQGISQLTAETERLLADMAEHPDKRQAETAATVMRAIAALKGYLDGLMAGAPHAELKLTPIFQEVVARRGGEPPAPSELFYPDTSLRVARAEAEPQLDAAALARGVRTARSQYQRGLLLFLQNREVVAGLTQMEQAVRQVERIAPGAAQYTFWWSVAGLMELLRQQRLPVDLWLKRLCGRIDLQMRRLMEGSRQLAERLFRDVLYYLAQDDAGEGRAAQARAHFQLQRYFPAEVAAPRSDQLTQLALLKENLGLARDHWVRYCSGRTDSLEPFQHAAMALFEASVRLPNAAMQNLARMVQAIAKRLPGVADATQNEALQLEMATALLLALNASEHFKALGSEFDRQSEALTMRLQAAIDPSFDASRIPEVDLLDEYSRKAQERLVVAQVTQEIQANLNAVEEILDRFFRDARERAGLPMVPGLMKQILGALNILQLDVAAQLVNEAILRIQHLTEADAHIAPENLDWVAEALSTLGMYVDALRYGRDDSQAMRGLLARPEVLPAAAEASVESELREETGRLKESVEAWVAAGADAAGRETLKTELGQLARDADLVGDADLRNQADAALRALSEEAAPEVVRQAVEGLGGAAASTPAPSAEAVRLAAASAETIDRELLATYIEEANEVLGSIAVQIARLNVSPYDFDAFTFVRRGFHTLKGSGRMVGLLALADVAWEVEQTLNLWLRDEKAPTPEMLRFLEEAANAMQNWVSELEETGEARVEAAGLIQVARRLRGADGGGGEQPPPKPEAGGPDAVARDAGLNDPEGDTAEGIVQEAMVTVGTHTLPAELFRIFTEEAGERLAALREALAEMSRGHRPTAWDGFIRAAHTLAGIARTTGFTPLADAAHALELWAVGWPDKTLALDGEAIAVLEDVLHALGESVAGIVDLRFPEAQAGIAQALAALHPAGPAQAPAEPAPSPSPPAVPAPSEAVDELDAQLLPVFLEEAHELMPRIGAALRAWRADPAAVHPREELKRTLHTLKGSSRMAGAMRLGEAVHALETRILELGQAPAEPAFLDELEAEYDRQADFIESLRGDGAVPGEAASEGGAPRSATGAVVSPVSEPVAQVTAGAPPTQEPTAAPVEEMRFRRGTRLKADILDILLNEAGEVAIARARIENVLNTYKLTALELASNVERLRGQLRELEIQAESQMRSRLSQMDESQFDPLEFDRFSRLQELTRLLAESVNDVSTAQDNLLAGLNEADNALAQQSRMTRTLQEELMHLRMLPLNALSERLHRVLRQTARETGKRARLELDGGQTELDRAVLDKIAAPLEHLVRNAVVHGLESPAARLAAGKGEVGEVRLAAGQEGNEIVLTLSDDGAGVDFAAVRARAQALGWIAPEEAVTAERLEQFLFRSGFSTATSVTEVAGRGIGLDVVRSEIAGIGGRVRLDSEAGHGSRFTIRLPLTLAMTQVVLARAGGQTYALHANLITLVREVRADQVHALHEAGAMEFAGESYPLRTLAELVGRKARPDDGRFRSILFLKAGEQRLAVRVDAMEGNFEAVVKNIGPQLARIAGISGATVLGDGRVVLILNPFQLAERAPRLSVQEESEDVREGPLVLVVDDSLTVRKITGRLLAREGYRVATARDGVEALEILERETPAVMLLDIEMPRMDGFEVAKNVRSGPYRDLPIIMITSRTAEKHRRHARELGVDAYLGKPYQDEELLGEIRRLTEVVLPA